MRSSYHCSLISSGRLSFSEEKRRRGGWEWDLTGEKVKRREEKNMIRM